MLTFDTLPHKCQANSGTGDVHWHSALVMTSAMLRRFINCPIIIIIIINADLRI